MSSYPRPTISKPLETVHPRELVPPGTPPASYLLYPPLLPACAKARMDAPNSISEDFVLTMHLVPAAYPRVSPYVSPSTLAQPATFESKEHRKTWARKAADTVYRLGEERQERVKSEEERGQDRLLWNCVNRYVRKARTPGGKKSVTLFLAHANGLPKETWEPSLRHLLSSYDKGANSEAFIDEIWAFESVNHGDSALVNDDKLGLIFDWMDNARDILNFLARYLPSRKDVGRLPTHLPRIPDEETRQRESSGFSERLLIPVGHSLGGCTTALAALTMPQLFSGLILVDPVIVPRYAKDEKQTGSQVRNAMLRRAEWSNRDEARSLLSANPFFSAWDPIVLEIYLSCGLVEDKSTGMVRLKTTNIQEAAVFASQQPAYEVFERLCELEPRIPLRFVMAGRGRMIAGSEETNAEMVWRRPENAANVRLPSSGHLIPQEVPEVLANHLHAYLGDIVSRATSKFQKARL